MVSYWGLSVVGLGGKVYITDDIDGFWETRTET